MSWRQRPITPLLILAAVFLLQWLLLFSLKSPTWDAVSYYAYARSAVFDNDLDFANDYRLSYPTAGAHFTSKAYDQITTSTGRVENVFAIGAGLLWLPWLALLRLAALLNLAPGVSAQAMTGYELFFTANISMLSAVFGLIAFFISYLMAEKATGRWIALAATVTFMLATPMLYYQFREPMYSHTASAMMVALCVLLWWRQRQEERFSPWQGLALGALIGLAGMTRWQNLAYLALPVISTFYWWVGLPTEQRQESWRGALLYLFLAGLGMLGVFALQMSVWRMLYGSFITIPQGGSFMDWRAPFLSPFLFSSFRGLLPWMPIFFLSFIGLLALTRKKPHLAWPLLGMLLVTIYINGSTRDWFAGGGYGPRRLTSELALLTVGYAGFVQLLPSRIRGWIALFLAVTLGVHQWLLLRFGLIERIGGKVVSMAPTFEWQDEPLGVFLSSMGSVIPGALQQPLDTLVFPGSPLDLVLRQQSWPWAHLGALLASALLMAGLIGVGALARRWRSNSAAYILAGIVLLLLAGAEIWILNWA